MSRGPTLAGRRCGRLLLRRAAEGGRAALQHIPGLEVSVVQPLLRPAVLPLNVLQVGVLSCEQAALLRGHGVEAAGAVGRGQAVEGGGGGREPLAGGWRLAAWTAGPPARSSQAGAPPHLGILQRYGCHLEPQLSEQHGARLPLLLNRF